MELSGFTDMSYDFKYKRTTYFKNMIFIKFDNKVYMEFSGVNSIGVSAIMSYEEFMKNKNFKMYYELSLTAIGKPNLDENYYGSDDPDYIPKRNEKPFDLKDLRPLLTEFGSASRMIGATLQNTANPSMLAAGYKENVIPGEASAVVDGRFLPGYEEEMNATIREIVGPDIRIETIVTDIALEVPFEGDLVDAMCAALIKHDGDGIPVPFTMSGGAFVS